MSGNKRYLSDKLLRFKQVPWSRINACSSAQRQTEVRLMYMIHTDTQQSHLFFSISLTERFYSRFLARAHTIYHSH